MRILYIIDSLDSGGKERRLVTLIHGLLKTQSAQIELIVLSNRIHYTEIYNQPVKLHIWGRNLIKDKKLLFRFINTLKRFNPNIVHCWDNIAAVHFAPICKWKGIPFINSMITAAPPELPIFSKRYLSNAISYPFSSIVLTNSKAGLDSFRVPKNKARFIHNGIDISRFSAIESVENIKAKFNIKQHFIVGMVASFTKMKDYKTLVKAAEIVLKTKNNVGFVAIGDGPEFEKIMESIPKNYKSHFYFLGRQKDVDSIINIFDIGVLSTFTEGISNSIMEYMLFAKPVIATEGGGTAELIINEVNGFLVRPQAEMELANKINYLLENPEIVKEKGKAGRTRILNYFSLEKMVNKTFELYCEVIK